MIPRDLGDPENRSREEEFRLAGTPRQSVLPESPALQSGHDPSRQQSPNRLRELRVKQAVREIGPKAS